MITHISEALEKSARDIPAISRLFAEARVLNAWERAATGKIAQNSDPEKFVDGILYLSAKNSVWAQELNMLKGKLIEKVNSMLGEAAVTDIRLKAGMAKEAGRKRSAEGEGKKKCGGCGTEFSGRTSLCPICDRENTDNKTSETYRMLAKEPGMTLEGTKGRVDEEGFRRIKRNFKSRLLDMLVTGHNEMPKKEWERTLAQYTEAVFGKALKYISEKDVKGVRQAVQNKANNYSRRRKG